MSTKIRKVLWGVFFVLGIFFVSQNIQAQTIEVSVDADGTPVTDGINVYCYSTTGSFYSTTDDVEDDGVYSLGPISPGSFACAAYCSNASCAYAGYPQASVTVADGDSSVPASLSFVAKNKTIRVAVTSGSDPITDGISVFCSGQESPWTSDNVTTVNEDGTFHCSVTAGHFYISASCNTSPCDYSGYPHTTITVASGDTTVDASLSFVAKDKTISVALQTTGGTAITSGMRVFCSEQGGSGSYASAEVAGESGTYDLSVGTGRFYCSANCSNYSDCAVAGNDWNDNVIVGESDSIVSVTLDGFLVSNSTLSGIVTDGSSGVNGVWVNINSHAIASNETSSASGGGDGTTGGAAEGPAGTTNPAKATGTVAAAATGATSAGSQVYLSAQTDANGAFQVSLPAGTYTVSAWPPYDRQDLASASTEVTVADDSTTTVSLQFVKKTAQINVSVTDSNGTGVSSYVYGNSYNGSTGASDWFWAQTDGAGNATVYGVEGLTYSITANPNIWSDPSATFCSYTNEGPQQVKASATPQTASFTVPLCNCTMTVNAKDSEGNIVSSIFGSIDATPTSFADGEYYHGTWGNLSSGTGTIKVQQDQEDRFNLWFWDNDYIPGDEVLATCTDGSGSVDLAVSTIISGAVSGGYVDDTGATVTLDNTSYLSVYAMKGHNYRSCTADASSFSCDLSEGTWRLGYWINPSSGYASSSAGSTSSEVVVTSAGGLTQNIALLKTGSIAVTLLNADGSARPNSWVEATPYSVGDEGGNDYQAGYASNGCLTDADGLCTLNVGAAGAEAGGTAYYLNAYLPYSLKLEESLNNPGETAVTVIAGESTSATLAFTAPDGSVNITVIEGNITPTSLSSLVIHDESVTVSPVSAATVDLFSSAGGSFSKQADENGVVSIPCSTADTWYAVVSNLIANSVYLSAATAVTCSAEGTSAEIAIDWVATAPESVTVTSTNASQQLTVTISDGFSVSFPPNSLGGDGETVSCTVAPVMTPVTANRQPVSFYGYNVSCFDNNGVAITQLSGNATFNVPYNADQAANMMGDAAATKMQSCYLDDSTGAYKGINNSVVDETANTISFQQTHLTDFAIVGNGNLGALQGTDGGAIGVGGGDTGDTGGNGGDTGGETGAAATSGNGSGCGCNIHRAPTSGDFAVALFAGLSLGIYFFSVRRRLTASK